jgi:hypothetical protein
MITTAVRGRRRGGRCARKPRRRRRSARSDRPRRRSSPAPPRPATPGWARLGPELAELNTLAAAHGEQAFLDALARAVAFGRWRAADVRSILAAGTGTPQPTTAGDALVLELPRVPTRPLSDYALGGPALGTTPTDDTGDTAIGRSS